MWAETETPASRLMTRIRRTGVAAEVVPLTATPTYESHPPRTPQSRRRPKPGRSAGRPTTSPPRLQFGHAHSTAAQLRPNIALISTAKCEALTQGAPHR